MARRSNYNGTTKTIAATTAQILTWTASEVQSEHVVAHVLSMQGADNDLTAIDRIRVYANGTNIYNFTIAQLQAWWQSYSGGANKYATSSRVLTIPYCLLDAPTPEMQDICQFPTRTQVTVEVFLNNTTSAGFANLGWIETDVAPVYFPRLLSSAMNIPASTALQRYNFQENGIMRGVGLTTAGIDRAKVTLGGQDFINLPGAQFLASANIGDMLTEAEALYGNGVSSAGTPLTSTIFYRLTGGVSAPQNSSYVELQTGAAFAGVAAELTTYAIVPNALSVPQAA